MHSKDETYLYELMIASQKGDASQYHKFLERVSILLTPFIQKKVTHSEFVDDILQDTLVAIHNSRHTFIPGRSIAAWTYVICEHRIIDFYRKYRRVEKAEIISDTGFSDFETPEKDTALETLEFVMEGLPEKQKTVIEMMKLEGLSIKEVAVKTGMSESAIKVNAFRGYQAMKRILGVLRE